MRERVELNLESHESNGDPAIPHSIGVCAIIPQIRQQSR